MFDYLKDTALLMKGLYVKNVRILELLNDDTGEVKYMALGVTARDVPVFMILPKDFLTISKKAQQEFLMAEENWE